MFALLERRCARGGIRVISDVLHSEMLISRYKENKLDSTRALWDVQDVQLACLCWQRDNNSHF